ncbi:hypothetical protein AFLA_004610 [Aspergillus flavus NRRL3357]|nr:hypothetical protein AFLA_004610 [Aspergillus flavus NRRL3357]
MAANASAVHHAQSSRSSNIAPSNMGGERNRGSHGGMGQPFGGGKASWKNTIWGDNLDQHAGDKAFEGKAGSSSLLSSSESDGWNGRPNMPWSTVNTSSNVLSRATNNSSLAEAGDSSYLTLPRSAAIGGTAGSTNHKAYLNTGSEGISPSGDGIAFSGFGNFRNTESRRHANSSAFGGSPVGSGFPMKPGFSTPLESTDPMKCHLCLLCPGCPRLDRYTLIPIVHSESRDRGSICCGPADINSGLSKLHFNEGSYAAHPSSTRPGYLSHPSFDGSFQRLKYQGDEPAYQGASYASEGASDVQLGYQAPRNRMGDNPISPTEYARVDSPLYAALDSGSVHVPHYNSASARLSDAQAAALERRLREQELAQQAINPLQRLSFTPYDLARYQGSGMNALSGFYPVAQLGAAALASRGHRDHDPSQTVRSPVLEEFRANSKGNKRYELKDIYNHVVEFSGDQHGSRFIQQKLETANSDEKEQVFREIQGDSLQLMTDVFGNYVVQKLFEHGNQTQKKILANQMKGHILALSTQMYGCRVVQKALEHILTDQQASMVKELEHHVLRCVRDQNGNHVIQKAIERVPSEHVQFVINAFIGQVEKLATHPYGCRVIQRMLEHCKEEDREAILAELHVCTAKLIPDQFGNYVIQHVIENGEDKDRTRMVTIVMSNLLTYSKHKFASNVVEKSIEFGQESQRHQIISMLTSTDDNGENPLLGLIRDQFGNYVIQKVLCQLKGAERDALVEEIKPLLSQLKKYSYGKQIAAIEKLVADSNSPTNGTLPHTTSTTPPNSHKSSPQPSKRAVNGLDGCRAPVVGAAPPTPPPIDPQSNGDGSSDTKTVTKSTPLTAAESAGTTPTTSVEINGAN